jgi:cytidylate kinase
MKTHKMPKIVAIDGPAGSGKSTIASLVSKELGWNYLNTGALYRLIGFLARESHLSLSADKELAKLIKSCEGDIEWRNGIFYYKNRDITVDLQSEDIGMLASEVGKSETVRALLLPIQRKLALFAEKGVIIDGRDIGTVVFPSADLKLFMIADLEARAQRRYNQLAEKQSMSHLPSIKDLIKDIKARDEQDAQRSFAPLQKAKDAIEFDTSSLSIEGCVRKIVGLIKGLD